MDTIQRIFEYKRLALIMRDSPSKELALELAGMCDTDRKLRSDRNREGFSFLQEQASIFIGSIDAKCRPSVRDSMDTLISKAGDILLEVADFEAIPGAVG